MDQKRDVIIACDFASAEETLAFLDKFTDVKPFVKIGMELYYAAGPDMVRQIKARGHKIFLGKYDPRHMRPSRGVFVEQAC